MNFKDFLKHPIFGHFQELSHLSAKEQSEILAKARREAMVKLGLSGKATVYFILYLILGVFLPASLNIFMELSSMESTILMICAAGGGGLIFGYFYRGLIRQGLLRVIQQQNA